MENRSTDFTPPERELFTAFSCFQCLSVWSIKYDFFPLAPQATEIFHNDSKLAPLFMLFLPSSEFKSVINYIDAGAVLCNERFLRFDVVEVFFGALGFSG